METPAREAEAEEMPGAKGGGRGAETEAGSPRGDVGGAGGKGRLDGLGPSVTHCRVRGQSNTLARPRAAGSLDRIPPRTSWPEPRQRNQESNSSQEEREARQPNQA